MAAYLLPVGLALGLTFEPGGDLATATGTVRLGDRFHDLDQASYRAWVASHACVGRSQVERLILQLPGPPADPGIDALVERGLLIELDPAHRLLAERLQQVALVATGVGLGNQPDNVGRYRLGRTLDGPATVSLPMKVFTVWAASRYEALDEVCRNVAGPMAAAALAAEVVQYLPAIIGHRHGYLDRPARRPEPWSGSAQEQGAAVPRTEPRKAHDAPAAGQPHADRHPARAEGVPHGPTREGDRATDLRARPPAVEERLKHSAARPSAADLWSDDTV
jgi:hypothetical protein